MSYVAQFSPDPDDGYRQYIREPELSTHQITACSLWGSPKWTELRDEAGRTLEVEAKPWCWFRVTPKVVS